MYCFAAILGFKNYTQKRHLKWFLGFAHTHMSHLSKKLCQRHIRSFASYIKHIASRILSHIELERGLLHTAWHTTSHMRSDQRNEGITITSLILSPRQSEKMHRNLLRITPPWYRWCQNVTYGCDFMVNEERQYTHKCNINMRSWITVAIEKQ